MQDNYLVNLQNENQELAETCAKMQQIMQQQQEEKGKDTKMRSKLKKITANKNKLSKNLKTKDRELRQLKSDLNAAKQISKGDTSVVKTMRDEISSLKKDLSGKEKTMNNLRNDNQSKDSIIQQLREELRKVEDNPSHTVVANPPPAVNNAYSNNAYQQDDEKETSEAISGPKDDPVVASEDDEYKDDSYEDIQESNHIEESQPNGEVAKEDSPKAELKDIISEIEIEPLFQKIKLILQTNEISYSNLSQLFPDKITIISLEHKLRSLGLKDAEERLAVSRYIVEPREEAKLEFDESREISKEKATNIVKSKIEGYEIYQTDAQEMQKRFHDQIGRFVGTLKDALECEDLDGTGYIPAKALKGCFHDMDINLDSDIIDYLVFLSGVPDKMGDTNHLMLEYAKIVDLATQEEDAPKGEERKSTDLLEDDYSDGYGDDFEDDKKESVQESQEVPKETELDIDQQMEREIQQELAKEGQNPETEEAEGEGADIDDEQMISIAENCLIRIAEELLNKNVTVRQLFEGEILAEEIEGEKIELLFPTSFLEGIQKLGITEFSDIENA